MSDRNTAVQNRFFTCLLYASPLVLAFLLYGYCLSLPFFLDDGPHFRILAQTDGLRHWGDFPAFPFYRPFVFTLWKIYGGLAGDYDPVALHGLNLFCYGLSGVLIGQIVRRVMPLSLRMMAAVLAGAGFVIFPFSYQAVALVAAQFHLMLALGVTGCLWLALRWLDDSIGVGGLIGCWICAFVAIFSHETGVLLPAFLVGLIFIAYGKQLPPRRKVVRLVLPIMVLAAVYAVLWLSFRPAGETHFTEAFVTALAALIQGLIYPFARLLRPLVQGDMAAGTLFIFAVVALAFVIALVIWRLQILSQMVIYGLGWYLVAILPAALLLPAGYVLGQLRLALLASVGGAMFWGIVLAGLFYNGRTRTAKIGFRVLAVVMIGLFAYVSLDFLAMRRADFLHLRDFNREALRLFAEYDVISGGAVLVNAPDYVTPDEADRRFLLGTEGVLWVDETLDYNQQFWMNSDLPYDNIQVIGFRQIQRSSGFGFRAHPPDLESGDVAERVRNAAYIFVTVFEGKRFWPVYVGGRTTEPPNIMHVFYPEVDYALWNASAQLDSVNRRVIVRLKWASYSDSALPEALKIFVHVYCDTTMIGQSDGYPWGDTYPFAVWQPDEILTEVRYVPVDTLPTPECLRVYAGLYREADLSRLRTMDAATGERYEEDRFPVPLVDNEN